jgi:myosin heavy subunit
MYEAEGFLEKNKDPLSEDIVKSMRSSKHQFVQNLFREEVCVPNFHHETIRHRLSEFVIIFFLKKKPYFQSGAC